MTYSERELEFTFAKNAVTKSKIAKIRIIVKSVERVSYKQGFIATINVLEVYSLPPKSPDIISTKLCYWAPHELWFRLSCPEPASRRHLQTSSSKTYKHTVNRQVLAFSGFYNMASKYLKCTRCKKRYISWSNTVLNQLSFRHRSKFPAILTYRYACEMEVVGMMRERSLGNSYIYWT